MDLWVLVKELKNMKALLIQGEELLEELVLSQAASILLKLRLETRPTSSKVLSHDHSTNSFISPPMGLVLLRLSPHRWHTVISLLLSPHVTNSLQRSWFGSDNVKTEEVKLLSHVRFSAIPLTVAHQAPPSMAFSRQEYWSGVPFPFPGDLPNLGIKPRSPTLQAVVLPCEPPGKP